MAGARANDEGDGIISLVKETADNLGRLISDHIKLARVEIVADARDYGRHLGLLAVAGVFLATGYAFAWLAAALALARWMGAPLAFLAVGGAHLVGGALGLAAVRSKLKHARVMNETVNEVSRSVATLAAEVRGVHAPAAQSLTRGRGA